MSELKMNFCHFALLRIWTLIFTLCIIALCLSGAQIRFPELLNIFGCFRTAILLHNTAGLVLVSSFVIRFLHCALIAFTIPKSFHAGLGKAEEGGYLPVYLIYIQLLFGDFGLQQSTPGNKIVMIVYMSVLLPLICMSGILLMNVSPLWRLVVMSGGFKIIDTLHFLTACILIAFLFNHPYLMILRKNS